MFQSHHYVEVQAVAARFLAARNFLLICHSASIPTFPGKLCRCVFLRCKNESQCPARTSSGPLYNSTFKLGKKLGNSNSILGAHGCLCIACAWTHGSHWLASGKQSWCMEVMSSGTAIFGHVTVRTIECPSDQPSFSCSEWSQWLQASPRQPLFQPLQWAPSG